ncbi:MAG: adenylyl-sulfate reductase subunit alpha [Selenomonadaceae bacterium]|nr:adenylyl-sulfate reductase subunit alpha [Selenomonadaceae bacterium]
MKVSEKFSDVLIIGGGAAGLFAAIRLSELNPNRKIIVAEKANIDRSGCLAAGVNALNAYITPGKTPRDYADYAIRDAHGIARYDLLLSMSERLNEVTRKIESMGLVIQKDSDGNYVARGNRNIKINGENIKPILARAVKNFSNVEILNHVNIVDLIQAEENQVAGAWGFHINEEKIFVIRSQAVLISTGGAAGLYRPNHTNSSRHKMWYSPFNTGAGFAMGIRAGAEMTSFEMRFIALRCKDTIAPTGTIAQGIGAAQINSRGEKLQFKNTTSERVFAVTNEKSSCYLETIGISKEQEESLERAYFNMNPAQSMKWLESGLPPSVANVEIEGTEPYVVGGHTASGFWIDANRKTTIENLFAAGDAAGGCPQKYVTGSFAEGEISAESIEKLLTEQKNPRTNFDPRKILNDLNKFFTNESLFTIDELEEAMQSAMDDYAGGIKTKYRFSEIGLGIALKNIERIENLSENLRAESMYDLLKIFELRERLLVCRVLIEHMKSRRETRWRGFGQNLDFPRHDSDFDLFVNSRMENGKIKIHFRKMVE